MDGRLFEVGEIHRDLGQAANGKSCTLDETESAIRKAHGLGDFLRDVDVGRVEEDVVGDEKLARSHDGCSGGGMNARFAEVGAAGGIGRYLVANAFKLPAANVFQILAFGGGRSRLVEIDRDLIALPDLLADVTRHGYTIFKGDAFDGDEGDDIGCAHARVRAFVIVEVDQLGGLACAEDDGFLNGLAFAGQRDDRAVVIEVALAVEQVDAGHFHGVDDEVYSVFFAAFGKIGNALDERGHKLEE